MELGEFGKIATSVAIPYARGQLQGVIVPALSGKIITEEMVRHILEIYATQLKPYLPPDVRPGIDARVDHFAPRAMKQVAIDRHMNDASGDTMTKENAEAILVAFVNFACIPMDLAFYTRNLLDEPQSALV